MAEQVDNGNLQAKLMLRRELLEDFEPPFRVLDCCQGSGVIWSQLREEFKFESYLGLDLKLKPGRLRIDSSRFLDQPGWDHNVIDIDTYGHPWKHYFALLRNAPACAMLAFLTIGDGSVGPGSTLSKEQRSALGIGELKFSDAFSVLGLHEMSFPYCLARCLDHGFAVQRAVEAKVVGNARYIGLHLRPER